MRPYVSIGGPILLFVLGAIFFWAVTFSVAGISIHTVGMILMVAAVVWLVAGLIAASSTRRAGSATVVERRDEVL